MTDDVTWVRVVPLSHMTQLEDPWPLQPALPDWNPRHTHSYYKVQTNSKLLCTLYISYTVAG